MDRMIILTMSILVVVLIFFITILVLINNNEPNGQMNARMGDVIGREENLPM